MKDRRIVIPPRKLGPWTDYEGSGQMLKSQPRRGGLAIVALIALVIAALFAWKLFAQPAPSSVGDALWARGYRSTVWVERFNEQGQRFLLRGIFNPASHDPVVRYGWGTNRVNGSLTGERCAGSFVVGDQQGSIPECIAAGLGLPVGYRSTAEDTGDLAYVEAGTNANACDVLAVAFGCLVVPVPVPTSTPAPVATPTPSLPPPQPTPTIAPPAPTPAPPLQCRPGVRLPISEACRRAVEQLGAGKPNGPRRTQGIRECPLPSDQPAVFVPGVLGAGQTSECLATPGGQP